MPLAPPQRDVREDRQLYPPGVEEGRRSKKQQRGRESPGLSLVAFWASRGALHVLTLLSLLFFFASYGNSTRATLLSVGSWRQCGSISMSTNYEAIVDPWPEFMEFNWTVAGAQQEEKEEEDEEEVEGPRRPIPIDLPRRCVL
ncbi:hypothetical protein TRV_05351 [Trichophyton verrucosum HKI 0517]|uniref:Uncharacterized protein n=1 Tax=Trichophyton verrucosum (strain HKI 0517) TaxID=663202 RepID=D4DDY7_TRIVH|nr:uncharacterized protein TRV_05351 [Trichophyton verrucosum HKI 0517]EFE39934.1 hypothetical protein TRV_05351 [Trichophyton verrucosum HKI 0517]